MLLNLKRQLLTIMEMLNENYQSLVDSPDEPNLWLRRGLIVLNYRVNSKEELDRIKKFAEQHPKSYLFWDYRRQWIVEDIDSEAIINELEFTKKILSAKGTKNYQAWSHRQWIIKKFATHLWLDELQYCHEILEKDKFNVSAWDQLYHTVRLHPDIRDVYRDEESEYAKKAIYAQPGNEGPWLYLKLLYADDKKRLYTNPDLECIYVDVLVEAANHLKYLVELDPHYKAAYAAVDSRDCIHALNIIIDLMVLGYQADRNARLVEAVDFIFDKFCCSSYLLEDVPKLIQRINSEISRKVLALMHLFDASRIRCCYMYSGCHRAATVDEPCAATMDNPVCCVISSQSQERLNTFLDCFITSLCQEHKVSNEVLSSNSESHLWRNQLNDRLCQSYLQIWKGREIAEDDTLEDLIWNLRQFVVKNIGTSAAASVELDYTTGIIKEDAYNRHAWSHRQWVLQTFFGDWVDEDGAEIEFCRKILDKDSCNSFAWDQRYFVVTRWVLIIKSACGGAIEIDDVMFVKIRKLVKSFQRQRNIEINYALNVIDSEPENQFPWSHIYGVCNAYLDRCLCGPKVRDAILRVLQGARDCVLGLDAHHEGIMGNGGQVATSVNARGVMNALNMLMYIFVKCGAIIEINEDEEEKYRNVLKVLCPNSFFDGSEHDISIVYRMLKIMRNLREGLAGYGLLWENAADGFEFRFGEQEIVYLVSVPMLRV